MKKPISKKTLQNIYCERFSLLHDFLIKNNINYYAVGGTALGAFRHNGFIPWDDDMDIVMKRNDYEKFIEIANELDNRYLVAANYHTIKNVEFSSTRVYLVGVINGLKSTSQKYDNRFYIDIFPVDAISLNVKKQRSIIKRVKRIRMCLYLKSRALSNQKIYKKILLCLLKLFLLLVSNRALCKKMDRLVSSFNKTKEANESVLWTSSGVYSFDKETHSVLTYGTPSLHKFDSIEIFVPQNIELFLQETYGIDYMTPRKRTIQDNFSCFLTEEYEEI